MQLKKLLAILSVMLIAITADAQIKYHPIVHLPDNADARVFSEPDRSSGRTGDNCAIIKIAHSDMNFTFDIGSLVVNKTVPHPNENEIWVYVPVGTNRIKISHPKYGSLDTPDGFYWFEGGLKCQSGQVYRIRLETKVIDDGPDIITDDSQEQNVQFKVTPANAKIRIMKMRFETDDNGIFERPLPIGRISYRVSADDYYDNEGFVETLANAERQTVTVNLQHRQGLLSVTANQQNATIMVDGQEIGRTPLEAPYALNTGTHTVVVTCPDYRTETRAVTIEEDKTTSLSFDLYNGADFTISSTPSNSVLYIDGEKVGVTPHTIGLISGEHDVKLTHNKYKDFVNRVHFDGSQQNVSLRMIRQYIQKNSGYASFVLQAGSFMGIGGTIGGYFQNLNVELAYITGLSQSDKIYWNYLGDVATVPVETKYKPNFFGAKLGYGITLGTRMRLTPQAGLGLVPVSSKSDNVKSQTYAMTASIGARFDYVLTSSIGVSVGPEYSFPMSSTETFKSLSNASSTVKGWANGFNCRIGFFLFI